LACAVRPPLFYALSKAWIFGSDSLLWMKLFPVLWASLAIIPFALLSRELRASDSTFNLALFLISVNEYLINYSQELRMYSLLLLLVITSMWLFARSIRTAAAGDQVALFVVNLLMVYTHYYAWLVVACEFLFVVLRRRDRVKSFVFESTLLVAAFLPWAWVVGHAAYNKGGLGPNLQWNTRPWLRDFFQHYVTLNGPVYNSWRGFATVFSSILFFGPIIFCGRERFRRRIAQRRAVTAIESSVGKNADSEAECRSVW